MQKKRLTMPKISPKLRKNSMANIKTSLDALIGNTPLLELCNIEKKLSLKAKLLAKLEFFNPAGSVKDRVALQMINDAEESGLISSDTVIIEPTSGNTGIGISAICAQRGYKAVIIMPDTMSVERIKLMSAYGAEVILTDGKLGMQGAIDKANELHDSIENSIIAGQFTNPSNPKAHYLTTGPEIFEDTDGAVDIFVCGVGTGGTVSGVGKYLKEKKCSVKIVAVEPVNSAIISGGSAGKHGLQGIGAGFIPKTLDLSVIDSVVTVSDGDAYDSGRLIAKNEGVLVGISSGAALYAAISLAKQPENDGKNIVVLLPDTGQRYLSTENFL